MLTYNAGSTQSLPRGSCPTCILDYMTDPNHKTSYPPTRVAYDPLDSVPVSPAKSNNQYIQPWFAKQPHIKSKPPQTPQEAGKHRAPEIPKLP